VAEPFDLILCDIGLPDLNGFALARQIRAAGVDAPLLALSGYTSDQDRSLGLASGFDNYLTKPIKASVLREEVRFQGSRPRSPRGGAAVGSPAVVETPAPVTVAPIVTPAPPRRRGVLGGLVVIALGVPFVLQPLGVPNAASYLFIAMGVAFLIAYVRGRQYVYLIPMVTLVSFGVALLLPTWIAMRPESAAPAFVGVIAVGFIVAFALSPQHRWPLVPAVLLGVVAAGRFVTGTSLIPGPSSRTSSRWCSSGSARISSLSRRAEAYARRRDRRRDRRRGRAGPLDRSASSDPCRSLGLRFRAGHVLRHVAAVPLT